MAKENSSEATFIEKCQLTNDLTGKILFLNDASEQINNNLIFNSRLASDFETLGYKDLFQEISHVAGDQMKSRLEAQLQTERKFLSNVINGWNNTVPEDKLKSE